MAGRNFTPDAFTKTPGPGAHYSENVRNLTELQSTSDIVISVCRCTETFLLPGDDHTIQSSELLLRAATLAAHLSSHRQCGGLMSLSSIK